MEGTMP